MADDLARLLEPALPSGWQIRAVSDTSCIPRAPDAIDVLVGNTFPPDMLSRCTALRWIQLTGSGYEHLLAELLPSRPAVTNAGEIPARAVAEFAWMAILGIAKESPRLVRQHDARTWQPIQGKLLAGCVMVLAGLGPVGRAIARRAPGFDVRTIGLTRSGLPMGITDEVYGWESALKMVERADIVVLALPGGAATRGLFNRVHVERIKRDGIIVNIGRASTLDAAALKDALVRRHLRGALLDVHDEEPLHTEHPLWSVPNLWVTPHCAFAYADEVTDVATLTADNFSRFANGTPLQNEIRVFRRY